MGRSMIIGPIISLGCLSNNDVMVVRSKCWVVDPAVFEAGGSILSTTPTTNAKPVGLSCQLHSCVFIIDSSSTWHDLFYALVTFQHLWPNSPTERIVRRLLSRKLLSGSQVFGQESDPVHSLHSSPHRPKSPTGPMGIVYFT